MNVVCFALEYVGGVLVVVLVGNILPWIIARVASERFLFRCWPLMGVWTLLLAVVVIHQHWGPFCTSAFRS